MFQYSFYLSSANRRLTESSSLFAAQCKAVIICNQGVRGGRLIDLKPTVDAAVKSCPTVQHVFVSQRTEKPAVMGELDVPLEEVRLPD